MRSFLKVASFLGLVVLSHRTIYAGLAGCHGLACLTTHHTLYAMMAIFYALLAIQEHQPPHGPKGHFKLPKVHLPHCLKGHKFIV